MSISPGADREAATVRGPMPRLASFLRSNAEAVLAHWEVEARQLAPARKLDRVHLRNDLPDLLEAIVGRTLSDRPLLASMGDYASAHAVERLDHGYDLGEVITEFAILRRCLVRALEPQLLELEHGALEVLHASLDEAVRESVVRYTTARERTLAGLERISAAALESEGQDLLPHLLKVMKETSEAVDTIAVLLKEGDRLVVRACAGLEEREGEPFSTPIGEGFSGLIAATGRARLIEGAAGHPDVNNPQVRSRGVRALYGVPLVHGGELIGVAHMGSTTAHRFSDEDLLFFRAMTHRATALLVQARLMRRERRARADSEAALLLLDTALSTSPSGLAFLDRNLRYVRVNDALAQLSGRPAREHLGKHITQMISPEGAEAVLPILQRCLEEGAEAQELELQSRTRDGRVRSLLASFHPVAPLGGPPIGVGAVVVDITERKEAAEALRASDHRFRMALRSSRTVVFEQDAQLRYQWMFNAQLGLDPQQVVGKTDLEVFAAGPELEQMVALKQRLLQTGARIREEVTVAVPGATPHHFMLEMEAIRDEAGEVLGLFGVAADITERKQAQLELERTEMFREQFIGVLGHDLRNPLNAITASAHLLFKHGNISEAQVRAVRRISSSADKMARMISDILDFARGRLGGGIPIERKDVDLGELAAHAIEELHLAHPKRQLVFDRTGDATGCWDADRVAQVVGNLVGNALQHGAEDRPVTVAVKGGDEAVELTVHNEGPVLDEDAQKGLFEPFRGASKKQATGGLGLGLYIVNLIVQAHGGSVEVVSTQEQGTTFRVLFPRGCEPALGTESGEEETDPTKQTLH